MSKIDWNLLYGDDWEKLKLRFKRVRDPSGMDAIFSDAKKSARQKKSGVGGGFSFAADSKNQRVVVKARFGKSLAAHKKFLQTYMVQADKDEVSEKPVLFGSPDYNERMVASHLKFIVSPESAAVPLDALVARLVRRLEFETGYDLVWQAAVHKNTGQSHAHILVNGVDRQGREVRFSRDMIRRKMREISCDIATAQIGARSDAEIEAAKSRSAESLRLVKIDDEIEAVWEASHCGAVFPSGAEMQRRLQFLARSGLAKYDANTCGYALAADWRQSLAAQGRYNTFLAERQSAQIRQRSLSLYGKDSPRVFGVVEKVIKMDDEGVWNNALVVRDSKSARRAWYAPLFKKQDLKAGDAVLLASDGGGVLVRKADFGVKKRGVERNK